MIRGKELHSTNFLPIAETGLRTIVSFARLREQDPSWTKDRLNVPGVGADF